MEDGLVTTIVAVVAVFVVGVLAIGTVVNYLWFRYGMRFTSRLIRSADSDETTSLYDVLSEKRYLLHEELQNKVGLKRGEYEIHLEYPYGLKVLVLNSALGDEQLDFLDSMLKSFFDEHDISITRLVVDSAKISPECDDQTERGGRPNHYELM